MKLAKSIKAKKITHILEGKNAEVTSFMYLAHTCV